MYFNPLWNGYSFDDSYILQDNKQIQQGISAIPEIFTSYYHQEKGDTFGYRPVVRSLYAIEWSLFGNHPGAFHLLSILYFCLLCFLIFQFLKSLFPELNQTLVVYIVLLFATHPIHTEVVASLKNREEIIAMILGIVSLILFLKYIDSKKWYYLPAIIFVLFIAVLTKENALTYPLLFPFIYFIKKPLPDFNVRHFYKPILLFVLFFIPAWLAWKMPDLILENAQKDLFFFENPLHFNHSFTDKIFMAGTSLWFYIKILVIPYPLRFYYGFNMFPETTFSYVLAITFIFVSLGLFVLALRQMQQKKPLGFFILFFFISISVFTNYFIPVNGIVGERLAFQASLGYCGAFTLLLFNYFDRKNKSKSLKIPTGFKSIMVMIIIIFSLMVIQRNKAWKSYESLLKADIEKLDASAKGQVV
ncbi:MAG: hypothetical protein CVU05_16210, partial [Bacteroidetes bacterium HGW-Bacteroidetes-21]